MAKSKAWDATLKQLVRVDPSAFVRWLLPDADFVTERPTTIASIKREVDVLHEVTLNEQHMLLHIEFQTYNDVTMPNRLLRYNVLLEDIYNLPVLSCVIYLLPDGRVQPSPLHRRIPGGQLVHIFLFVALEIGQLHPDDLINLRDETLLALLPLTHDGTQRSRIEYMFQELRQRKMQAGSDEQISEIEAIAFTLASFALEQKKQTTDLEWLKRRFHEMFDALEDTSLYKEVMQRVLDKGRKQGQAIGLERGKVIGLERGQEQGRITASRHSLQLFVQSRFPALAALAQEKVAQIDDLERLDAMIVGIGSAQTEEEAQAVLQDSNTL